MKNSYFKSQDEYDNIDVYELFVFYNSYFFEGKLEKCSVEWSERMTLCAGTCANTYHESCVIKLSAPILKFRTANEIKETLLHEMIHAYLFLTNPRACQTEGGHGPAFKEIMKQINIITELNITVYHNFHDEVDLYRKHIWKCDGICQSRPPFYGYVKRSMNRRPQPADHWFSEHQRTCGGNFVKVSGPDEAQKKIKGRSKQKIKEERNWGSGKTIDQYFKQLTDGKQGKKKASKKQKEPILQKKSFDSQSTITMFRPEGKTIADYCREMEQQNEVNNCNNVSQFQNSTKEGTSE